MNCLAVMNYTGDERLSWDKDDPTSIKQARLRFNELRRKGYAAFRADAQVKRFDPNGGDVLMIPQFQGG